MRHSLLALAILAIPSLAFAQNQPPVANAGPNRYAYTEFAITLEGTASDPDGEPIIGWYWAVDQAACSNCWLIFDETTPAPTFKASVPGDYVLALIVEDPSGGSAPDFVTIHVADNLPPVAVVTADVTTITVGGTVCFDGSQSYDPEGAPLSYLLDFADGSPYVFDLAQVCHTYTSIGTYSALLQVTDERSANDTDILEITVLPPSNHPPVASPTATPNAGDAPLYVQFGAHGSDADGDSLTYAWNFGDAGSSDNTSTLANPGHVYETPGTFVAWLTVSDGQATAPYSLTITVSEIVGVPEGAEMRSLALAPIFPNPVLTQARIRFALPLAGVVTIAVYDLEGRRVASLLDRTPESAGAYDVGVVTNGWPAGCYFVRLTVGGATMTRKMLVLK